MKNKIDWIVVGSGFIYVPTGCEYFIDGEVLIDG